MTTSKYLAILAKHLGERHVLLEALRSGHVVSHFEYGIDDFSPTEKKIILDCQVHLVREQFVILSFKTTSEAVTRALAGLYRRPHVLSVEEIPVFKSTRGVSRPSSEMMSDLFTHFRELEAGQPV